MSTTGKVIIAIVAIAVLAQLPIFKPKSTEEKEQECMEEKAEDLDLKYKSIDEALAAYDFETARKFLSCMEDQSSNLEKIVRDPCQNLQCRST